MKRKSFNGAPAKLRGKTQERLKVRRQIPARHEIGADPLELLRELQVHQVELEMQNDELMREQAAVTEALERYRELFEFAPIGYFILNESGLIQQVSLKGAALLGWPCGDLAQEPFVRFVAPPDQAAFASFWRNLLETEGRQSCDLAIRKRDRTPCYVHIEAAYPAGLSGNQKGCLLAIADLTARRKAELALLVAQRELEQRVRERTAELEVGNARLTQEANFESLLAGLSARFVNVPGEQVDAEIENAIRHLAAFLGMDHGALVQWGEDVGRSVVTHSWSARGSSPMSVVSARDVAPWIHRRIMAGRSVLFSRVNELPAEARADKAFLRKAGIRAMVALPMNVGGGSIGFLELSNHRNDVVSPRDSAERLTLIANVLAGTLEHKRMKVELQQRLRLEALAAEVAARFVHVSAEKVDGAIEDALLRICTALGLDRSALYQYFERGPDATLLTHLYQNSDYALTVIENRTDQRLRSSVYWLRTETGPPAVYKPIDAKEILPWIHGQICSGQRVILSRLEELPEEAAVDRQTLCEYGKQSTVAIPLPSAGGRLGWVSFAVAHESRRWSLLETTFFETVAQILAGALTRKRAEEDLRDSEEHLAMASEAGGAGLWHLHLDTNHVWVTPRMRHLLQFREDEELTFDKLLQAVHPEDRELVRRSAVRAFETGTEMRVEHRVLLADGSLRWVSGRGRLHYDSTGKPIRLTGASVDITERKRSEEALLTSEARLQAGADLAGLGYYEVDFGKRECFVDKGFQEICGFPAGHHPDLQSVKFWVDHIHPDDRRRVLQGREEFHKSTDDRLSIEYRYMHPTQGLKWIRHLSRIVGRDASGIANHTLGAVRDITERKRADEMLRQNEERLRLVLEANSEGVWDWNIPGGQNYFSPSYAKTLGYSPEEFVHDYPSWKRLVHPDDLPKILQAQKGHLKDGKQYTVEFRIRKKTGDWCWVRSRGTVVERDREGHPVRMVGTHLDITEAKQAEDRVEESEGRFELMANAAPVLIWACGTDKLCTFFNRPWLEFTGRTFEQELGNGWAEGVHAEDLPGCLKTFFEAFDSRIPFNMEYRLRDREGQYRWISDHGVPRYGAQGEFLGYIGSCVDITERKRADKMLRENEERLRLVLEANSEGVWDWHIPSGQVYFSPRYAHMLGYEPQEFIKDYASWKESVHPDDLPRVQRALKRYLKDGKEYSVEFRIRKKSGDWSWVRSRGTVVERDGEGRPIRMVGTHLDVTERKQAEDRVEESEERFELMANAAPVLIWACGTDKFCTFVNRPWLEFTGRTLEQELGEGWAEGVHPEDQAACLKTFFESFDSRVPFSMEYRLRDHEGRYRWVSDHGVPRYGAQGEFLGYIGSCLDITERKRAETELRRSHEELAHVSRISTAGALAGTMAHDLNQPLTAILSNAQAAQRFLDRKHPDLDQVREILADIVEEDRRAGEVILRMRAMLKKGQAKMSPLNLNLVIGEALRLLHSELLVREVVVVTHLAPELPLVRGDRIQLQQVLLNLIMNSCDAMTVNPAPGRRVTIKTERVDSGYVQVSISDEGPGFAPDFLEQPFEGFRTSKPQGLGLGLLICQSILLAHGGGLWVANNPGRGANVRFTLAVHEKETM